jgi:sugar lactone lactonase YvrE
MTSGAIKELRPGMLTKSAAPTPISITSGSLSDVGGIAFDKSGNLWATTFGTGDNTVLEFTKKQLNHLAKTPNPTAAATITSSSFSVILGCVFDTHGNLWLVDAGGNGSVHEISKAQLAMGSADITPAVTITSGTTLASPAFGAFDKTGNLWVSSLGTSSVVEYSVSQLTTSGDKAPSVIVQSSFLGEPGQLQFDSKGNLWVANEHDDIVVEFTKAQLASSGSPDPMVILSNPTAGAPNLATPWGLQFDSDGNLWVFNYTTGTIVKFKPAQLRASGSPLPKIVLSGLPLYSGQLTFGPRY